MCRFLLLPLGGSTSPVVHTGVCGIAYNPSIWRPPGVRATGIIASAHKRDGVHALGVYTEVDQEIAEPRIARGRQATMGPRMVTETIVLTAPEYPSAKGDVLPLPPLQPWLPEERIRAEVDWGYDPNRQFALNLLAAGTLFFLYTIGRVLLRAPQVPQGSQGLGQVANAVLVSEGGKSSRFSEARPYQLVSIEQGSWGRQSLRPAAAEAFSRMKAAALLDGIELVMLRGFSPIANQDVSPAAAQGKASPSSWGKSCSTASCRNHHTGYAIDIIDSRGFSSGSKNLHVTASRWVLAHAQDFKFIASPNDPALCRGMHLIFCGNNESRSLLGR